MQVLRKRLNGIPLGNAIQHFLFRQYALPGPPVSGKRHELNEPYINRLVFCPGYEIRQLIVIDSLHHHHIDFHPESPVNRLADIGHRYLKPVPAIDRGFRSEEHTSELQSRENLVCRLLLEKKKNTTSQK